MRTLEKATRKFLEERGWDKLRPADLAKSISIEAGELLELFQWTNLEQDKVRADKAKIEEVKKELVDIFLYTLYISVGLNLDIKQLTLKRLEYNSKKYPITVQKFKKSNEDDPDGFYDLIRKSYRGRDLK